jgi:L-alanine-DL-glutamate epimerase-like enolase superfamily enzyme
VKITSVDVIRLYGEMCVKGTPWNPVCVRINTDEGISGCGEIGLAYGDADKAQFGMAQDFAKLIIGMDPMNNEQIWEKIFRMTFWGMGGGTIIFAAMSAIDIALWDIKGKALGAPVYKLLGGKTNKKLRTYASQLQFDWGKVSKALVRPEEYAEAARKAMAEGYDCIKVDPVGFDLKGHWMGWSMP